MDYVTNAEEHLITLRFIDEDFEKLSKEMSVEQLRLFHELTKKFSDICRQEIEHRGTIEL